jgi:hypothetical protein
LDPGICGGFSRDHGGEFERTGAMGILVLLLYYITTYVVALRWRGNQPERPRVEQQRRENINQKRGISFDDLLNWKQLDMRSSRILSGLLLHIGAHNSEENNQSLVLSIMLSFLSSSCPLLPI